MHAFRLPIVTAAILAATPALAHVGAARHVHGSGFVAGFLHPLFGLDHVLAMVAVGLWAGLVGGRALLVWPAAFVVVMAVGGVAGYAGMGLPAVETWIAASVVVLGLLVAGRIAAPLALGILVCGVFAFFHGHAHGEELPHGVNALVYGIGFLSTTALLHAAGIALALGAVLRLPAAATRIAGIAVAVAGVGLLAG